MLTLPEHLSSLLVFRGVRVIRSLVLYVCLVDRSLSFCPVSFWPLCCLFFFDIRILIASLWYLQTLLETRPFDHLSYVCANKLYFGLKYKHITSIKVIFPLELILHIGFYLHLDF